MPAPEAPSGQTDFEPLETIEGVVDRIVYENPENGFVVARLRAEMGRPIITFVGELLALSPGETVRLQGRWLEDRRYGRQLRISRCETLRPTSPDAIANYLGSGLIPGIGPTYAKRLVETFGADTLRVIDEQPERLSAVPGIGAKRIAQIREGWVAHEAARQTMLFLQGHGVSPALAARIHKHYGDRASAVLRNNPYRMAEEVAGISFTTADTIARSNGLEKDAVSRIEAGLIHTLQRGGNEGHVFTNESNAVEDAANLLGTHTARVAETVDGLVKAERIVREGDRLFLPALHAAETGCAEALKRLLAAKADAPPIDIDKAIRWVQETNNIELSPEQCDAVRRGIDEKALVITGGPGTGKTTVINSLLAILEKKGVSFLLAAPTGRAAKRMEEATRREAGTIHRLLEFSPKIGRFERNENDPLITDLIVVDEASMIDVHLFHNLLKAIPPFARLILVGDVDQLPSVGPGNVLMDVIASRRVAVTTLQTVFRQAAESGIIQGAHHINRGAYPPFNKDDFVLIERRDPPAVQETIVELVANRLPARFGYDPVRDIQVLAPMRRGEAGVNQLNTALQEALNADGEPIARRGFRVGDKVMQLRNNYELEVYNGDNGVVTGHDADANETTITFDDGRAVIYEPDQLDELDLAYAATVHKAQGSEYAAVVIPFVTQHYVMLQRNVLYTAVTRGKQRVVIVGEGKAVGLAVRNSRFAHRRTSLADRLRNA